MAAALLCAAAQLPTAAPPRGVLLIVVDDMRPSIGAYNVSLAHTPNMDRLAAGGLLFTRAYVQYALCGPSRNSFMSGRRPDTTRVWNFIDHFREPDVGADWLSMPEYFKAHGFLTIGSGKVFHPALPPENDWPRSWSPNHTYFSPECMPEFAGGTHAPKCLTSVAPAAGTACGAPRSPNGTGRCPYPNGAFDCVLEDPVRKYTLCLANTSKDESRFEFQLEDQRIRDSCAANLEVAARAAVPGGEAAKGFFVACGFHKPHVPWVIPREFIDLYPPDLGDIPLAADTYAPVDMPDVAWHYPYDVKGFNIKFNATCNETRSRVFRRGYYAAVSYSDYNIGVLLDKLDALGVAATTAVAVLGDHGFHLGEHDTWAKMSNFEVSVRIPLIIRAPWEAGAAGKTTAVLAEAVDLYPTLAALAGLPSPQSQGEGVNGTSLEPVFRDPELSLPATREVKTAAFSQLAKASLKNPFQIGAPGGGPARNATEIMGYSVRVDGWRYTCWFKFDNKAIVPITTGDGIIARELYDHRGDKKLLDWHRENINVVDGADNAAVVAELHAKILDYIQLYPVGGPQPPAPTPSAGACEKQMAADGCLAAGGASKCEQCAKSHKAEMVKVGCTTPELQQLCDTAA